MNKFTDTAEREQESENRELTYLEHPEEHLDDRQRRWLAPPGPAGRAARFFLYGINWCSMKLLFRPRVLGREHLPAKGPFIVAPNHSSSLDPFVLSVGLGRRRVSQTVWAGRRGALLENPIRRRVNRLAHAIPINRNAAALAVGAAALERGRILVWFPEGHRSDTGELQEFKRGVGALVDHFQVPAVPTYIDGAYDAMPRDSRLPRRLRTIAIAFGPPVRPERAADISDRDQRIDRLVAALRKEVVALRESLGRNGAGAP
jgi:long-chain acyl-CoA synthetase